LLEIEIIIFFSRFHQLI